MAGNGQGVWQSTAAGAGTGAAIGGPWGALIGGGVGLLGGLLGGGGGGGDTSGAMKHLDDARILRNINLFFPELAQWRNPSVGGLLPMLQGHTNQAYLNASGSLNDIFARHGLLGSGLQGGGNASLQLARGSQLNQNQVDAQQFLWNALRQAFGDTVGLQEARAAIPMGHAAQPNQIGQGILGALQGAGWGAMNSNWGGRNQDFGNVDLGNPNNATFTPTPSGGASQGGWNWWNGAQ